MELKIGDKIPNFTAKDANGNDFDSKNSVGTGNMVSYYNNYLAMKHIDKERFL